MVVGRDLLANKLYRLLDLVIGNPTTLGAPWLFAAQLNQHVSATQKLLCALLVQDDARVQRIVDRECYAVVDVGADKTSHDVCRGSLRGHDQVDTGGAAQLCDAHDGGLNVLAGDHHKVGQLVDYDDKVRHVLGRVFHVGVLAAVNVAVVGLDVAHLVVLEDLQAPLHLGHAPLKGARGLARLGDHGHIEVRQARIARELDALGVDHDQAHLLGRGAHEHAHDDGVEKNRLARARGAGHQKVRQARKVNDDGLTLGVASKGAL